MDIIKAIGGHIVEFIKRELGYLCSIGDNMERLRNQVELLEVIRETVKQRVDEARRNAEDILHDVECWFARVDAIIEESRVILDREGQRVGLCENLIQRHQLSRQAEGKADEVLNVTIEGNFNRVSYSAVFSTIGSSSLRKIPDFMNFESRKSIMKQIMDALEDDNVNMIGVFGMGGIGKTMLVSKISKKLIAKKSFDEVITSTVSQTPDLKRIQEQLGNALGLKLKDKTVEQSAPKLYKRLKMEKRILVVLDDIWEFIDLEKIGIPSVVNHKGCKIIFTSRDKHILSNEMYVKKIFEIKVLEKDEPWNLFKRMSGEIVEAHDLKPIAVQIVLECAQLPIAITTVAKALRDKSSHIWKDALNQLKKPVAVNIRGMDKKVYSSLKLSYDYLQGKEVKLLFLLCSMFPEDFLINVEGLHVYAMGMGFLHGIDTVAQGRRRIIKLVDDLISSSLLLPSEFRENRVRMHDIIRDVAISISSKDEQIRTFNYVKTLDEWEEEKVSGNHTAVFLDFRGLHSPPMKLMLPEVQLLRLYGPLSSGHELAGTFFEEMKELKVLELTDMKISLLPPSLLYSFANVRVLRLLDCELENIGRIGELKKLEILSFSGSNIIQIPVAIRKLTQLKVLDLSGCYPLKVITPNILSKLTKLEELHLEHFDRWGEGEEEGNKERKNSSLSELRHLTHLSVLNLRIQDEKIMPKQLFSKELNLEKFKIIIGSKDQFYYGHFFRTLYLEMESGRSLDGWIKMLLKRSEELHLVGSIGARVFYSELEENHPSHLKHLCLANSSEFQHLIHEQNKPFGKVLSNLERLELRNLENLESIIHGHITESSFNKLRLVTVEDCNKLGSLLFSSGLDDLLNLESIKIKNCESVETIFVMATNQIEFAHLKSLSLYGLPRLQKLYSKIEHYSEKPGTSKVCNGEGDSFFSEQVSLPNLEELIIKRADNLKLMWHNVLASNSFSKLKRVDINSCNNLEKVFPSNVMTKLTCLQFLKIKDCNLLKGIFEVQEPNVSDESVDLVLPNLRNLELELCNLPNLEYVWSKDPRELLILENIKELSIHQCPKLKRVFPVKILEQLEHLEIDFSQLEAILGKAKTVQMEFENSKDGRELLLSKLRTLKLYGSLDCNLTHLPMELVPILHNLKEFEIRKTLIEEIFQNERCIDVEDDQNTRPESLRELHLFELPKLKHLWKENSQMHTSLLQNLFYLAVSGCDILNILVPSSASFRYLIHLKVEKCHRLTYLLNTSVARTLVQLRVLTLRKCERMITVIAGEAEEGNDEIVFNKLEYLLLEDVSKLTSFYSGKCIIRFPWLGRVYVKDCPDMKVFSVGMVSTPHLPTEHIGFSNGREWLSILKDRFGDQEIIVEDINVIFRQIWKDISGTSIQNLSSGQNLEANQSDHSSSHAD